MGHAGDEGELASAETQPAAASTVVALVAPLADGAERYRAEGVLGRGGMGLVSLRFDKRIGRRVAAKELRPDLDAGAGIQARFLREAQLQGQLEHPAIVPVHDLGVGPDGRPFFTMRNVRGATLKDILQGLAADAPEVIAKFSRHRLLSAFATVCLAVDYAHGRGILHRDLKPANLILGDYGEVYVIDWGVAKILGTPEQLDQLASGDTPAPTAVTHHGSLLGTPGYIAPEQLDGPSEVGVPADVYSLGAILFEILTLKPLHDRGTISEVLASTREGADARPSVRTPDREVPPELEAACVRATALAPTARFASARELHATVQRYLEGERDLELRHARSAEHTRQAREAYQRALVAGVGDAIDARRRAMREVGHALAFEPSNREAIATMVALLSQPPEHIPHEVEIEMDRGFRRQSRWIGGVGAATYTAMLGFLPLLMWMGIRQPATVLLFFGLLACSAGLSVMVMRARVPPAGAILMSMFTSSAAFAVTSRFGSPLILMPTALAVNATGYAIFLDRRFRLWVLLGACLGFIVPVALELGGVLPRTFSLVNNQLVIKPTGVELPPTATLSLVVAGSLAAMVMSTIVVGHIRDQLARAERRLYLYAWHLRELMPVEAQRATDPAVTRPVPRV